MSHILLVVLAAVGVLWTLLFLVGWQTVKHQHRQEAASAQIFVDPGTRMTPEEQERLWQRIKNAIDTD